jgi:nitrogen-specific signal transduction histidine kinase
VAPLAKTKPRRFLKELDPDLPMLYTDQDKLKHMLTHLLRHAGKLAAPVYAIQTASLERKE